MAPPPDRFSLVQGIFQIDEIIIVKRTTRRISLPPKFSINRYRPSRMYKMTDWDWAFQFAIRRSCWKTVQSLAPEQRHPKDTRSEKERREEVIGWYRIDKAIEMLLSNPIASWRSLEEYGLDVRHFWHLSYLMDNTISVSPAIAIPTLGELEELARRARYIASAEPSRLTISDDDPDTGELIEGSLDPDYVNTDCFLDNDPLIICIKPGNTPAALKMEFENFIDDRAGRSGKDGLNPNHLDTCDLADLYVLAYIDLKLWTAWKQIDFYGPSNIAWIIGKRDINDSTVSKRIANLADLLLDKDSRLSQELLARAAMQRNAEKLSRKPAKRGRRPKTK
ncbi:MAG TPA: hypothetical protein VHP14_17035 [Anaerolineales bacterium]|nr:hypothetical protein [Anaerolineales bacterium]